MKIETETRCLYDRKISERDQKRRREDGSRIRTRRKLELERVGQSDSWRSEKWKR